MPSAPVLLTPIGCCAPSGCIPAAFLPRRRGKGWPPAQAARVRLPLTAGAGKPLAVLRDGKQFAFQAPSYALEFGDQGPFSSHLLRVRYSSLTHPSSVYDINMETGESGLWGVREAGATIRCGSSSQQGRAVDAWGSLIVARVVSTGRCT